MTLFLIGLLASIPVSIVANLATPCVRTWLVGRSSKRKIKRGQKIIYQLAAIERYRSGNGSGAVAQVGRLLIEAIGGFTFALLFGASVPALLNTEHPTIEAKTFSILSILFLYGAVFNTMRINRQLRRIRDFKSYRTRVTQELKRLGVSLPEHLADGAGDSTSGDDCSGSH